MQELPGSHFHVQFPALNTFNFRQQDSNQCLIAFWKEHAGDIFLVGEFATGCDPLAKFQIHDLCHVYMCDLEFTPSPTKRFVLGLLEGVWGLTETSVVQDAGTGHWAAVGFCCMSVVIRLLSEKIQSGSMELCPWNSYMDCHCIAPLPVWWRTVVCDTAVLSGQNHPKLGLGYCKHVCGWPVSCSGVVC